MDKNTQRLIDIAKRRSEIEETIKTADASALDTLENEVTALNEETTQIRKAYVEELNTKGKEIKMPELKQDAVVVSEPTDVRATTEYRQQFKDYVTRRSDAILKRADAPTFTTDVGAVIPETILNRVVQQLKDHGEIFSKITLTNYKGGVSIPLAGAKPTAAWVAEGSVAEKKKQQITGSITFGYHKLQVRVASTLEAVTVSLDLFEQTVAANIAEAMVVALEAAIINGTGEGQPLGIVNDENVPSANVVDFLVTDATYQGWAVKLMTSIPLAYRKQRNGVILMNPATFDKYIVGLEDENGQPVARVTYGITEGAMYRFMGKEVILTDLLPAFDTAAEGDVFLIYANLSDYLMNSNMQLTFRNYFDEDTDEFISKATLIGDGKLADPFGVVMLKKDVAGS
jgi:HK97 family phage major capsid protein